jgi:hypothetical protein
MISKSDPKFQKTAGVPKLGGVERTRRAAWTPGRHPPHPPGGASGEPGGEVPYECRRAGFSGLRGKGKAQPAPKRSKPRAPLDVAPYGSKFIVAGGE